MKCQAVAGGQFAPFPSGRETPLRPLCSVEPFRRAGLSGEGGRCGRITGGGVGSKDTCPGGQSALLSPAVQWCALARMVGACPSRQLSDPVPQVSVQGLGVARCLDDAQLLSVT